MPSGWPSAIAPPFGLTWSESSVEPEPAQAGECLRGEGLVELDDVEACGLELQPLGELATAGIGPTPITRGATPAVA